MRWGMTLFGSALVVLGMLTGCSTQDQSAQVPTESATAAAAADAASSSVTLPSGGTSASTAATSKAPKPPTQSLTGPTTPSLVPAVPSGAQTNGYSVFEMPSKNIACGISSSDGEPFVECLIGSYTYKAPKRPADCELDWADHQIFFNGRTAGLGICRGDVDMVTNAGPYRPTLGYGAVNQIGSVRCYSRTTGLTCWDVKTLHGFMVSRSKFQTF